MMAHQLRMSWLGGGGGHPSDGAALCDERQSKGQACHLIEASETVRCRNRGHRMAIDNCWPTNEQGSDNESVRWCASSG